MISCHQYDYIEIACMYHYPVILTMQSGTILKGLAIDTGRNKARQECIKILAEEIESFVVLDDLSTLEVCVKNPHFQCISLN